MFDGVHRGHAALMRTCVQKATLENVPSVVYTYRNSPHPHKQSEVSGYLTPEKEKLALCEQLGVKMAVSQPFTKAYSRLSPVAFFELLAQKRRVSTLVCGKDYRFGYKGSGCPDLLKLLGREAEIEVICVSRQPNFQFPHKGGAFKR
jgi:riboflavin kinase/FMN adenylyltransferase